jgi:uncharacterized protein YeaO (DUF488 family)
MIKTKSIYDHKEDSDGTRILITVGDPPDWLDNDDWKKELRPDWNTLMKWKYSKKTEEDWKIYEKRFLAQRKVNLQGKQLQNYVKDHLPERPLRFSVTVAKDSTVTAIL